MIVIARIIRTANMAAGPPRQHSQIPIDHTQLAARREPSISGAPLPPRTRVGDPSPEWIAPLLHYVINPARRLTTNNRLIRARPVGRCGYRCRTEGVLCIYVEIVGGLPR
jgi:hypothetical protein